jgi:S-adenosylmethionine-diacylglycerol 3-amino-3-carboxypropyl transferase
MNEKIKYANCWEDADLLLSTIKLPKNSTILSIASGGDNSFALLTTQPKSVTVVDTNLAQLYLCELKVAAFSQLNYDELIHFLFGYEGVHDYFEKVKKELSIGCKNYWESNIKLITTGVLNAGKFENYFRFFRERIVPLIHTKSKIATLIEKKSEISQFEFYNKEWNNWRWRLLFNLFFSKFVLGRFGRTKSYLNQVEIPVANFIFNQSERHLQSKNCQTNYFLHYIFYGTFKPTLPFYLREENFEMIKSNLSLMQFKQGSIENFILKENNFDFCNFSNIFEYMDEIKFEKFHKTMLGNLPQNAIISYWNLMVERVFSKKYPATFSRINQDQNKGTDNGFFYKEFITEVKI